MKKIVACLAALLVSVAVASPAAAKNKRKTISIANWA